jgi:SAM-dependent methyltransferase
MTNAAAYYDRIADRYDAQVDGAAENRAMRRAFRRHVADRTPPGGTILDFGCGTGTDAEWYAGQGFRVLAYDSSRGMVEQLEARCRAAIDAGTIVAAAGEWEVLETLLAGSDRPIDTVAANFAVMNHFADLGATLGGLVPHLAPAANVAVSVINPFHWRDLRERWWWRAALRSLGKPAITYAGEVTTHRFFPGTLRRAGAPHLKLVARLGLSGRDGDGSPRPLRGLEWVRAPFWLVCWRREC